MKTKINIENYEEIMFRLVEGDFDEPTSIDLLQQIESDALFKFEWESWQKTKFVDPLENYANESHELTDKIILVAEPLTDGRRRIFYYWAAAASILVLIASMFLWNIDLNPQQRQVVTTTTNISKIPEKSIIQPVQNTTEPNIVTARNKSLKQKREKEVEAIVDEPKTIVPNGNTLAEIQNIVDSVPIKTSELAKIQEKKQRYTVTIETTEIPATSVQNIDLAQNRKVILAKVFTNTRLFLQRKGNGEPDKIILMGDENNYLCINLNYSEK